MATYMQVRIDLLPLWLEMATHPWTRVTFYTTQSGRCKKHVYLTPMDEWTIRFYEPHVIWIRWENRDGVSIQYDKGLVTYTGPEKKRRDYLPDPDSDRKETPR